MADRNYYESLGLSKSASAEEIKKSYRRLARQYHPDVKPGDRQAEAMFKEIQEAYDVLGDAEKRQTYDQLGHDVYQATGGSGPNRVDPGTWGSYAGGGPFGQGSGGYTNINLNDLFEQVKQGGAGGSAQGNMGGVSGFFEDLLGRGPKGRAGSRGPRAGRDLESSLTIPFLTAVRGGETTIDVAREPGEHQTLTVKIPPGTETGRKLRLKGQGEPGLQGGPNGSLTITVEVEPHRLFRRNGNNLEVDVPISVSEAILGAQVDVPTLDGTKAVTVPPGSSTGRKLRLRGQGVPAHGQEISGDLIAILKVHVPPGEPDLRSRDLIETFARLNPHSPRQGLW